MAGGAGGYFKTGNFVDYSNQDFVYGAGHPYSLTKDKLENPKLEFESPGLYYQQFLGNVIAACAFQFTGYSRLQQIWTTRPPLLRQSWFL